MEIIKVITDEDFGLPKGTVNRNKYDKRLAARAIILDDTSRVILMHVSKYNYYKLPGGGVDKGETIKEGLKRELAEEVGISKVDIITELGVVREYRDNWQNVADHYGYIVKDLGDHIESALTEKESAHGYETVWAKDLNEAIELVQSGESEATEYGQKFEIQRELAFLRKARKVWGEQN